MQLTSRFVYVIGLTMVGISVASYFHIPELGFGIIGVGLIVVAFFDMCLYK